MVSQLKETNLIKSMDKYFSNEDVSLIIFFNNPSGRIGTQTDSPDFVCESERALERKTLNKNVKFSNAVFPLFNVDFDLFSYL